MELEHELYGSNNSELGVETMSGHGYRTDMTSSVLWKESGG
jgi:hypothetical protein